MEQIRIQIGNAYECSDIENTILYGIAAVNGEAQVFFLGLRFFLQKTIRKRKLKTVKIVQIDWQKSNKFQSKWIVLICVKNTKFPASFKEKVQCTYHNGHRKFFSTTGAMLLILIQGLNGLASIDTANCLPSLDRVSSLKIFSLLANLFNYLLSLPKLQLSQL